MTPSSAKAKGRTLQKWLRSVILDLNPELGADDVRSTGMGQKGEDVQFSPYARSLVPIQVECKNYAKHAVYAHYDQAATHGSSQPVAIIKQNRRDPLAVVDAVFLLRLLRAVYGNSEELSRKQTVDGT